MKVITYIKGKIYKILTFFFVLFYNIKFFDSEKQIVRCCSKFKFHTQTIYSLWNTVETFNYIVDKKIEGDIVECGVWQGINLVLFQKLIEAKKIKNKKIYGFDTFEGIPMPSKKDITKNDQLMINQYIEMLKKDGTSGWNYASLEEVTKNYHKNTERNNNLLLIKGKVEDTLTQKKNIPVKISLLRLDTSLYEGTKIELKTLLPKVQPGGILIVEGYEQFKGVREAINEYFSLKTYKSKFFPILGRLVIYL